MKKDVTQKITVKDKGKPGRKFTRPHLIPAPYFRRKWTTNMPGKGPWEKLGEMGIAGKRPDTTLARKLVLGG